MSKIYQNWNFIFNRLMIYVFYINTLNRPPCKNSWLCPCLHIVLGGLWNFWHVMGNVNQTTCPMLLKRIWLFLLASFHSSAFVFCLYFISIKLSTVFSQKKFPQLFRLMCDSALGRLENKIETRKRVVIVLMG